MGSPRLVSTTGQNAHISLRPGNAQGNSQCRFVPRAILWLFDEEKSAKRRGLMVRYLAQGLETTVFHPKRRQVVFCKECECCTVFCVLRIGATARRDRSLPVPDGEKCGWQDAQEVALRCGRNRVVDTPLKYRRRRNRFTCTLNQKRTKTNGLGQLGGNRARSPWFLGRWSVDCRVSPIRNRFSFLPLFRTNPLPLKNDSSRARTSPSCAYFEERSWKSSQ